MMNFDMVGRLRDEEFGKDWAFEVSKWWESKKTPKGRLATDFPGELGGLGDGTE